VNLDPQVAWSPAATYRALVRKSPPTHAAHLAGRLALVALIIGTTIAISSTGRVMLPLVARTTLCWFFVVIVQMVAAALLIGSASGRAVAFPRAMALFFLGHAPWSLWLLAFAARSAVARAGGGILDLFLLTALVPLVWTIVIMSAFCREVLGLSARAAALRTFGHQALIWTFTFIYAAVVVQAWPRFLNLLGP